MEYEAVVGIVDAVGELFFFFSMESHLVAHVDEVCRKVGSETSAEGDGVLYGLVCLVGRVT